MDEEMARRSGKQPTLYMTTVKKETTISKGPLEMTS
jgi:hypothetical protein